ncbi:MAG: porin, partial [Comamonas sp.]
AVAASGAAFAQSSVTLFGTVDTSVAYVKESAPGVASKSKTGLSNDGVGSSALGFRGTEDLGNGLKANFWLEGGVEPDVGEGAVNKAFGFNRRSTLGLQGGFGEVRFGRELTAGHQKPSSYSVFGTIGAAGFAGWALQDVRYNNMVTYVSPNFGGFSVTANYAFKEKASGEGKGGAYAGIQGTYANGPLSVTAAYDQANPVGVYLPNPTTLATRNDVDTWSLGASYDFGMAKLSALYHNSDMEEYNAAGLLAEKNRLDSWLIGAVIPVGAAGKIKAQYASYKGTEDAKANQFGLGYEHALSKRTAVYTTYSYLKNKNGMNLNTAQKLKFGNSGAANQTTENAKVTSFQVGVRHNF